MSEKRLGRRPAKYDNRTLRLTSYLPDRLPAPPAAMDHASKVPAWPMYSNDTLGDCGPAGAAHQIQSWSAYGKGPVTPTDAQVRSAYFGITGGVDSGVYLLDMYNYWRKKGIGSDKIEAFVAVHPALDEARLSVQLFGSLGMGLSLPDTGTFGPWDKVYGPANPNNGHYVCGVAYDDKKKQLLVVTWGEIIPMSYAFFLKYCDEAYAMLNDLALNAQGQSPEGFDYATLLDDLNHIGDPITPVMPPTPPPAPPPTPPPTPTSKLVSLTLGYSDGSSHSYKVS